VIIRVRDIMGRSKRTFYVEAIDALVRNRIAAVAKSRDWELLEEIARIVKDDAPVDLAMTDPSMFIALRSAITKFHLGAPLFITHFRHGSVKTPPDRVIRLNTQAF
jgi:hypothetical protein